MKMSLSALSCAAVLCALAGCGSGAEETSDAGAGEQETVPQDEPPPPEGWTCDERWWGEGWCDCGCGIVDGLDCPDDVEDEVESCVYNACRGDQRPDPWDTVQCQPNFFSCNPDHILAEQLPRRHALPIPKDPPKR